ncbi:HesA/MoeB/ThiF family protein [Streptococcus gallolyticus]|uniref:Molybdopterin or thiamine biosynthesis adenylyltransferase n=1 Tax=Streptococcus gallolyticus TaxID=315405 RepID=A0A1I7I977_9STRE|nr:ThiF family adenylyltransferase [Streptococcus gallolyticus]SDK17033.1 Molybdopterin or thiamine biosynthesis adenylyltransferase [Streptococcus gallolyticus]SDL66239.1 Molybdopterin or thiamine biosynthesis adenylyltransferase [Streptococcus gallolyticus]SFC65989.1 Molybdopterin or thiamine biosynthesis adenylyltransferase [Streptococcus gallolyticus]SFU69478.1 Molybdopterin or thiamine biosynthesis adenylyltransferase [Streptococcus gallolyticus]
MRLPKIKDIHSVLFLKDTIRVGTGNDYGIQIDNPNGKYTELIKSLDGNNTVLNIVEKCKNLSESEVKESIDLLNNMGYIEDAYVEIPTDLSSEELERYSVNLNFFNTLVDNTKNKYDYQILLKNTHVLLLGLGGIGSNICLSLSELGIGKITAVDFDKVERSNLNRQVLYNSDDIGELKTKAAKTFINKFNPNVDFTTITREISSAEDVEKLIIDTDCDIVVNVADYPTGYIDFWVNQACVKHNKVCFSALVGKKNGRVYSIIPHQSACFYCQYMNDIEKIPEYEEELKAIRDIRTEKELSMYRTPNGALGASCLFHGYFIATEIMRYVFWGTDKLLTYNKAFSIDFLTFEQKFTKLHKYDNCPVCGKDSEKHGNAKS